MRKKRKLQSLKTGPIESINVIKQALLKNCSLLETLKSLVGYDKGTVEQFFKTLVKKALKDRSEEFKKNIEANLKSRTYTKPLFLMEKTPLDFRTNSAIIKLLAFTGHGIGKEIQFLGIDKQFLAEAIADEFISSTPEELERTKTELKRIGFIGDRWTCSISEAEWNSGVSAFRELARLVNRHNSWNSSEGKLDLENLLCSEDKTWLEFFNIVLESVFLPFAFKIDKIGLLKITDRLL